MRRILILVAALAMTIGLAVPAIAAVPADFSGVWVGRDDGPGGDGSSQIMYISPRGDGARVTLFDTYASICGGGPILARGAGPVSDKTLSVTFNRTRCFNGTYVGTAGGSYVLQPDGRTIVDGVDATWHRLG